MYLATGSSGKLSKMPKIAQSRGDPVSRFHNALYAGDVASRITVLRDVRMREFQCALAIDKDLLNLLSSLDPLAYLTAKTNGLTDIA